MPAVNSGDHNVGYTAGYLAEAKVKSWLITITITITLAVAALMKIK